MNTTETENDCLISLAKPLLQRVSNSAEIKLHPYVETARTKRPT